MRVEPIPVVALMVTIIGVVLALGYMASDIGSQWGDVQLGLIPLIILIALAIVCVMFALRRDG